MFASTRERLVLMSGLAAVLVGLAFAPALIAAQTSESTHPSLDKRRITGTLAMSSESHNAEGHSSHQAAYILYPQGTCLYSGTVTFSSTAPVDIMVYSDVTGLNTGGLTVHKVGDRSYAVTTLLANATSGTVDFVGAAVLAHTADSEPYGVVASVDALRKSDTLKTNAQNSACQ